MSYPTRAPRAWHKKEKRWIKYGKIYLDDDGNWWKIFEGERVFFRHEFEFDWPTGLHDKHGKEAYHKDICKVGVQRCVIEWDKGMFYLQPIGTNQHWSIQLLVDGEILGNVHEHPALLEDHEP